MNAADVWMIERRERFGFALEARDTFGILGERFRQHLDRHVAIELRIARSIHFTHATHTQRAGDLERADPRASSEGHQFVGTRRFSSSNQCSTTMRRSGLRAASPQLALIIRKIVGSISGVRS